MEGSCAKAVDAIDEFGEGDLGRLKGRLLQRHTRSCGRCAFYLGRMETVVDGLARLGRVYAPDDLVEAVMACVVTSGFNIEEHDAAKERGHLNLALVAGAAGVGVGVAVALAIARWVMGREHDDVLAPVSSG